MFPNGEAANAEYGFATWASLAGFFSTRIILLLIIVKKREEAKKERTMLRRVCFIVNYNLYESKRHFTQKLSEAMERQGIETLIVDVQENVLGTEVISSIRAFHPDITCSFNSSEPMADRRFFWDFLGIPHWSILVDPALYSVNLTASPLSLLSCVDRGDCKALESYGFNRTFFFPHAVERELHQDPQSERPYDVVFLGSCYDYESLRTSWRQRNPDPINAVLDHAIDIVRSSPKVSLAEALVGAWEGSRLPIEGVDFMALFYYLDNYTRGRDRIELIRSIKDAPVHVFGELSKDSAVSLLGWKEYLGNMPNVTLHPSVSFSESFEILKKSKICLNSMPFFRDGTHERIFAGLACGALPITSESLYLRESFKEGEHLLYYRSKHLESMNEQVNGLLRDDVKRCEMVNNGASVVEQFHTWDVRVGQLQEALPLLLHKIVSQTA